HDYDAFVCYADDDYEFVAHLIEFLEQHDIRIATREHLLPGHLEYDALTQLIDRRCRRMLIILSPQFLNSNQCDFLAKFAASIGYEQRTLKLIPVIYQHCNELPAIIRQLSKVDLSQSRGYEWALRKLIVAIKSVDQILAPTNNYPPSSNNIEYNQHNNNISMMIENAQTNESHNRGAFNDSEGHRITQQNKTEQDSAITPVTGNTQTIYTKQPNGFESVVLMPGKKDIQRSKPSLSQRIRYLDYYKTPPFFMAIISLVQLAIFVRYGFLADEPLSLTGPVPFRSALIYNPYRRYEFWRYVTYMFIHAGVIHIFFNIVVQLCIGVPLEMVHGFFRIFVIYIAGVVGGALGNSITDPGTFLAGASGGCHALIAAHLSNVIINWSEMDYRWFRLISLLTFAGTDTGTAVYERYFKEGQSDQRTSYSGHLAGAVSGLLLGLVCLRNLRVHRWERVLGYVASMVFIFLLAFAILFNVLFADHFPIPDYRETVWSASPFKRSISPRLLMSATLKQARTQLLRVPDLTKRDSSYPSHMMGSRQRSYSSSTNAGPVHKGVLELIRGQRSHSIPNSFGSSSSFQENINQIYVRFFKKYHCYDLVPISAKLVVFDTQLLVKKAFHALINNGCRAAPLWDSAAQEFVGMLSITDFINIIRTYHKSPTIKIEDVEDQKIEVWRKLLNKSPKPLVSIGPDACLLDAILTLTKNKVHRLPIIDPETGNVLYILTHKRILKFLFLFYHELPQPSFLFRTLRELKVGSYDNICTTTRNSLVITALDKFIERRVSALPVVDEKTGKVVDIFAKYDAINMAAEKTYNNLSLTVGRAIERHSDYFEGVVKCKLDETLGTIIHRIVKAEVHRIVVVDDDDKVTGIVSLSDILTFLAIRPLESKDVHLAEEPFEGLADDEPFS
ncbi:5'-AMP-activated protein kinase subunit gamma-1, partial [Fragariocoptes setiger]